MLRRNSSGASCTRWNACRNERSRLRSSPLAIMAKRSNHRPASIGDNSSFPIALLISPLTGRILDLVQCSRCRGDKHSARGWSSGGDPADASILGVYQSGTRMVAPPAANTWSLRGRPAGSDSCAGYKGKGYTSGAPHSTKTTPRQSCDPLMGCAFSAPHIMIRSKRVKQS